MEYIEDPIIHIFEKIKNAEENIRGHRQKMRREEEYLRTCIYTYYKELLYVKPSAVVMHNATGKMILVTAVMLPESLRNHLPAVRHALLTRPEIKGYVRLKDGSWSTRSRFYQNWHAPGEPEEMNCTGIPEKILGETLDW